MDPPLDWDTPAKLPKLPKNRLIPPGSLNQALMAANQAQPASKQQHPTLNSRYIQQLPPLMQAPKSKPIPGLIRTMPKGGPSPIVNSQSQFPRGTEH